MKNFAKKLDDISRRDFVERSAKSMLGVSVLPFLGAAGKASAQAAGGGKAKNCIFLFMSGGMTHIDTFDPKTGETAGPSKPIKTNADGLQLSNFLPGLAKHGDKLAVVRSMTSTTGVHENGRYLMRTGYRPRATIVHPCLGPWAQSLLGRRNETLPDSVVVNTGGSHPGAGFFPARLKPIPIKDPKSGLQNIRPSTTEGNFEHRMTLANKFDQGFRERFQHGQVQDYTELYEETLNLMTSEDLAAFDINKEPANIKEKYGDDRFGQGCLLARRLVEHGVRYVEVELGGWDMHNYIGEELVDKTAILDKAMAALLGDLEQKGLLEETIVVLCSEFGRTPNINMNSGRDHYPKAFSTVFAGGGIRGGQAYGATDKNGAKVVDKQATIQDFVATVGYAMGLPTDQRVFSSSGRPFTVGDKGKPITGLFG